MGFALTMVYVALTIISPEQLGPGWAHYHALEFLAGTIIIVSLPSMVSQPFLKSSVQTFLLVGLFAAIALSEIFNGWFGGVFVSWQLFLPSAVLFFFIVTNVTTIRRLKIVILVAVGSCLVLVVEALCGYYGGYRGDMFVLHESLYSHDELVREIFRIRGVGFLNDPNDFAQILLIAVPLIFIIWRPRRFVHNSLFVLLPVGVLLWAVYLTHSRGALVGLAVLALMVARQRLGTTVSTVVTAGLVMGMMALDFTGGRGISASEGADRLEAWASGMEMFKSAPIFGVGFNNFADLNGITAHNSFVLSLAELGIVGSILWLALLVTTTMSLNRLIDLHEESRKMSALDASSAEEHEQERMDSVATSANDGTFSFGDEATEAMTVEHRVPYNTPLTVAEEPQPEEDSNQYEWEITTAISKEVDGSIQHVVPSRWVVVMRLALISFMATSWFLSRTYSSTMYLILGLSAATVALEGGGTELHRNGRWIVLTLWIYVAMILFIYAVVRLRF